MANKKEKMQISIYQIREDLKFQDETWEQMIGRILSDSPNRYYEQTLTKSVHENYNVKLFVCNDEEYSPKKIIGFYKTIVEQGQSLYNVRKRDVSTIMFVYNDENMFVVTTGVAHTLARNYADNEFGLKIMSGLINTEDNIKSISEKGVIGSIVANTRYFRGRYNLNNENDFGKLLKEVCAQLPREVFVSKLGFSENDVKKSITCIGKSSFKVNKSISIERLFELISKFEVIQKDAENVFNSMIPIYIRGSDKDKYYELTGSLIESIYNKIKNKEQIEFDISNQEYDIFYKADGYNVFINNNKFYAENVESLDGFGFLFDMESQGKLPMESIDSFKKCFNAIRIHSFSADGDYLIGDKLLNHINGEYVYNGKTYFILDGLWLELKDNFESRLNQECIEFLGRFYNSKRSEIKWKKDYKDGEASFIEDLREKEGHYKIHPIKCSEQIELCDSIKVQGNITYMFFVKDGFDRCMRDLTSQVIVSCSRITELRKSNEQKLIEDYYDRVYRRHKDDSLNKNDFVKAFCSNEIVVVVAFRPGVHKGMSVINNPEEFKSNIAKYSLISLIREFRQKMDFNIEVLEIETAE